MPRKSEDVDFGSDPSTRLAAVEALLAGRGEGDEGEERPRDEPSEEVLLDGNDNSAQRPARGVDEALLEQLQGLSQEQLISALGDLKVTLPDQRFGNAEVTLKDALEFGRSGRHFSKRSSELAEEHRKRMQAVEEREAAVESALQLWQAVNDPSNSPHVIRLAEMIRTGQTQGLPAVQPQEPGEFGHGDGGIEVDELGNPIQRQSPRAQPGMPPEVLQLIQSMHQEIKALKADRDAERAAAQQSKLEDQAEGLKRRVDDLVGSSQVLKLWPKDELDFLKIMVLIAGNQIGVDDRPELMGTASQRVEKMISSLVKNAQGELVKTSKQRQAAHRTIPPGTGPPVESAPPPKEYKLGHNSREGAARMLDLITGRKARKAMEE